MDPRQIIIRPIVTEKTHRMRPSGPHARSGPLNAYTFEVHPTATRRQVKRAVEQVFDVKVLKVNTLHMHGKPRRRGKSRGRSKDWKKAVVFLAEGQAIAVY